MCTIPEPPAVPPPPPPPLPIYEAACNPSSQSTQPESSHPTFMSPNVCTWAIEQPELRQACAKNNICLFKPPFQYKYKHYKSIGQVGPTCGLVALSMYLNEEVSAKEMLDIAKLEGYTCNGEMLSCKDMLILTKKVLSLAEVDNVQCSLQTGGLFSDDIIKKLLDGAALLVAYDADCNHSPCLRQGHTAHWCLVCGIIIIDDPGSSYTSDPTNIYILAKHGKSNYLSAWRLDLLEKSNKNLKEFSPKKCVDGLIYVLPDGGMGGVNGLRDQFLLFEDL